MPITISKAFSGGGFRFTSTGIVTDGLVLHYNPSFPASYPGSGTSLFDLSGNGFTSAVSGGAALVTSGDIKALSFDGSNDYATLIPNPATLRGDAQFTVCGWFKRKDTIVAETLWAIGGGGGSVAGDGIDTYMNFSNEINLSTYNILISTATTYPLNEWVFCAWQKRPGLFSRSNITIWRNLVSYTNTQLTMRFGGETSTTNLGSKLVILGSGDGYGYSPIDVATFMIYNRVLTSAEITRTYNATKTYVGL